MIDDQRLREIEERAAAAAPGPWEEKDPRSIWAEGPCDYHQEQGLECACKAVASLIVHHQPNAAFIAHSRQDVPDLIAELRRSNEGRLKMARLVLDKGVALNNAQAEIRRLRRLIKACGHCVECGGDLAESCCGNPPWGADA